jgi:hypothetical protein
MPRPQTQAAAYLNAYKLTTEKARLQQELESLKLRQQRIEKQLAFIDSQVAEIEKGMSQPVSQRLAPLFNHTSALTPPPAKAVAVSAGSGPEADGFETMTLEY